MNVSVNLWGKTIGVVTMGDSDAVARFQYVPEFISSEIQVSPIKMPLSTMVYEFPELDEKAFKLLPGMLADSLPDKFGNALIDTWLAKQGRLPHEATPLERLCYIGKRGMGALEFKPEKDLGESKSEIVQLDQLVALASDILKNRSRRTAHLDKDSAAMQQILRIGTTPGGARAKALIAWNRASNEIRSGQAEGKSGYEHWLIKLDGVEDNRDKEEADKAGNGSIEYAYYLMAKDAGITMSECRLQDDGHRRHFMTRRFDRTADGKKFHMQSLGGLAHMDFNQPLAYSYEQAFQVMYQLKLPKAEIEEQFRRMTFNICARNQDDHVKNISFLMDQKGLWSLSPAYDVMYSYNPRGKQTGQHQLSVNGKRDNFTMEDLARCGEIARLKRGRHKNILNEVLAAVDKWNEFAEQAQLDKFNRERIGKVHRTKWE